MAIKIDAKIVGYKVLTDEKKDEKKNAANDEIERASEFDESDPDRCIVLKNVPKPALNSLRWPKRPNPAGGNPSWTYMVKHPQGSFAVFLGHISNGSDYLFECWINGIESPRGLGALAKTISMDLRSEDRRFLKEKLEILMEIVSDDAFELKLKDDVYHASSIVAGFAKLVYHRANELNSFEDMSETPVYDALMSTKPPQLKGEGTLSRAYEIVNPTTGDDFTMTIKELVLENGQRRPYSIVLSGSYPKILDGLCESISMDLRVLDPAWVSGKLKQLLDFSEPRGDYFAWIPGKNKQMSYPSIVSYMATLILYRFNQLGIVDENGDPVESMGIVVYDQEHSNVISEKPAEIMTGKLCKACGKHSVQKIGGCDQCTNCGEPGECG